MKNGGAAYVGIPWWVRGNGRIDRWPRRYVVMPLQDMAPDFVVDVKFLAGSGGF